ncbi:Uncharacterised protein [Moraxella lacunata]|uniref:Uncharacterized protein n=1 Tax=Moraxella lacunata TaxID=477 RepID=A0A378QJZ0_MORLA|nr:Uncharacterised protein [Moraxella lacunata]
MMTYWQVLFFLSYLCDKELAKDVSQADISISKLSMR